MTFNIDNINMNNTNLTESYGVIYTPRGQGTNLLKLSTGQKLDVSRL